MIPGETFVGGMPGKVEHLFVVLSKPNAQDEVAIVNFTGHKSDSDESCIIDPGDHPWVTKKTIVAYDKGNMSSTSNLALAMKQRQITPHAPVSGALLLKIQEGALISPHCEPVIKAAVLATLGKS